MSRESPTLLFGAADPSDDACTSSQFQINQITLKRRASIHSEYHSDSSEWRESSSSEQQQQESSDGSTRVGTSAEAWRSRMLDCCQDLVEDYSRWITYVCSTVVVLLGIIFALFLFRSSIRGWCTLWSPNDNNCVRLPLWLSGLSWIPMNNTAAVRSPDGSLFDGFVARYYCTSSASKPGHEPTWLFEQPVVLNRLSSSARQPRAELDLLVGILSACSNFKSRSAVRQTWMR